MGGLLSRAMSGGCLGATIGKAIEGTVWLFVFIKGGCGWRRLPHSNVNLKADEKVPDCESLAVIHGAIKYEGTGNDLQTLDLATGDILLFNMTHIWGQLAQVMDKSPWDHVAMVVKSTDPKSRAVLISKSPLPTKVDGTPPGRTPVDQLAMLFSPPCAGQLEQMDCNGTGAYIYPIHEVMLARGSSYKYCLVRKLVDTDTGQRGMSSQMCAKLERWVQTMWGRAYETNPKELLGVLFNDPWNCLPGTGPLRVDKSKATPETLFCSEMVAEAWQQVGLLDWDSLNSNEVSPKNFAIGDVIDDRMEYNTSHGYTLSDPSHPPVLLLYPGSNMQAWVADERNVRFCAEALPTSDKKDS